MRLTKKELQKLLKNGKGNCRIKEGDNISSALRKKARVQRKKIEVDGYSFASQSEAEIYWEFKHDPNVEILKLQPAFCLQPSFKRKSKKYRAINYTADFRIMEAGKEIVVEVKSRGTLLANSKSYPMRRKLLLKKLPQEIIFREIIFDGKNRTVKEY